MAKNKYGIVMEGGAMRGLFTLGVTDVLMENNIEFDGGIGVSAGAGFGCNYVSKQPHRAYRYIRRFCKDWRFASFRSLALTGDLYGSQFIYYDIAEELDPFDFDMFRDNPMEFYAVATDLYSGQAVYHKFTDGRGDDMLWMRGSASLPIVSKPVRTMDGRLLLDGGLTDAIPLKYFEKRGYNRNLVILTRPKTYRKPPVSKSMSTMIRWNLRHYPNAVRAIERRHNMYNSTLEYIRKKEKSGDIFIIEPPYEVGIGPVSHDRSELKRVYMMGRAEGTKRLEALKKWMAE